MTVLKWKALHAASLTLIISNANLPKAAATTSSITRDFGRLENRPLLKGIDHIRLYQLHGDEVHEVAVGPIHAGIIEPGHFRFQCHGESVYNLEINLGYQHRGIESMMIKSDSTRRVHVAESIAGDTVIGHTHAHCNAVEGLSGTNLSLRAADTPLNC